MLRGCRVGVRQYCDDVVGRVLRRGLLLRRRSLARKPALVFMVGVDGPGVEAMLSARGWACPEPGCAGWLRPWGWARRRRVFLDVEERGEPTVVRPRRARCARCGVTQVLLDRRLLSS